ncbi:MAG: response regulator [Planctomycetes bacterium]|nr:response regulator [Planctomycetota bacterium]
MTSSKIILIVEDHEGTAQAMQTLLTASGYSSVVASDGSSAVRIASQVRPAAIIVDLGLPCGGGHEVIVRLRDLPDTTLAPIIVTSGADDDEARRALRAGAKVFLRKPVDTHRLLACLNTAMTYPQESRGKVVIAEDDADAQRAIALRLQAAGFQTACVSDGASVIPKLRQERPDLLLLDLGLPGGDGYTTMERIHQLGEFSDLPIVVVSAREPVENAKKAMDKGAKAFIAKPFHAVDLVRRVEREITLAMLNEGRSV